MVMIEKNSSNKTAFQQGGGGEGGGGALPCHLSHDACDIPTPPTPHPWTDRDLLKYYLPLFVGGNDREKLDYLIRSVGIDLN